MCACVCVVCVCCVYVLCEREGETYRWEWTEAWELAICFTHFDFISRYFMLFYFIIFYISDLEISPGHPRSCVAPSSSNRF